MEDRGDLRSGMNLSTTTNGNVNPPTLPAVLIGWSTALVSLAGLLGIVTYGVVRASAAEFFGAFGLAPEEVGFDWGRLLASSLTVLAVVLLLLALGTATWVNTHLATRAALDRRADHTTRRWKIGLPVASIVVAGAMAVIFRRSLAAYLVFSSLVYFVAPGLLTGTVTSFLSPRGQDGNVHMSALPGVGISRTANVALILLAALALPALRTVEAGQNLAATVRASGSLTTSNDFDELVAVALGLQVVPVRLTVGELADMACTVVIGRGEGVSWLVVPRSDQYELRVLPRRVTGVEPLVDEDVEDCWPVDDADN